MGEHVKAEGGRGTNSMKTEVPSRKQTGWKGSERRDEEDIAGFGFVVNLWEAVWRKWEFSVQFKSHWALVAQDWGNVESLISSMCSGLTDCQRLVGGNWWLGRWQSRWWWFALSRSHPGVFWKFKLFIPFWEISWLFLASLQVVGENTGTFSLKWTMAWLDSSHYGALTTL